MAEYIERDDVLTKIDKFVKLNEEHGFSVDVFDIEMMKKMIKKIPTMDVVTVEEKLYNTKAGEQNE